MIPDPVGVFENLDRLGPVFFRKWKLAEKVDLKNPEIIQDRIPAPWLARKYFEEALSDYEVRPEKYKVIRPSAFSLTNLEWARKLAFWFEKKTAKMSPLWNLLPNFDGERKNTEPVKEVFMNNECEEFFNEYSEWLLK